MSKTVEVNFSLPEAIKEELRNSKVLKELCTNKEELKGEKKVSKGENVLLVIQKKCTLNVRNPIMSQYVAQQEKRG